jgi:hypothetical protein
MAQYDVMCGFVSDVWQHAPMARPPRPIPDILDDLATVERYLVDAPPHSGSGHRDELFRRAEALRRELAAARSAAQAPQSSSEPSTDTNDSISPG